MVYKVGRNDRSDEGMDGKEKRRTLSSWKIDRGLADFHSLYAQNGVKVEPAEHLPEKATIFRKSTADGLESDGGFEMENMNNNKESLTEWRIQDALHNVEFDVSLEKDTRRKEITIQCKDREERFGELQLEKSKVAKIMMNHLYDGVSGREQGAGNGGTETEKRKAAWNTRNDLSVDTFGRPQGAENGATETDQVFMLKKINEDTEGHIQDVSQNPELDVSAAMHMPEMDTSQKGISSQCKEGTESDGELQPEWSKTASDLSDGVSGREQGAENCVTETERSKASWDMRNDVSADVLGREQEATNGGTGAEQAFMTKIDNKNTQWHIQDALHNVEFDVSLEKDTRRKEITIQCKDREERVGELQLEKSKDAKVMRNHLYDDVFGREQGAGNGGTETEKGKAAWDTRNDLSVDTSGRLQGPDNGETETDQVFMMKKINENTDATHVLKKCTNQREFNSQCKDEMGQDGELHSEKSKAARDMRNDSSYDVPDAEQVLEKDMGLREIKSQCKDEKQRDGDLHPERNKVSRYLRNDSSDDVPGREHGAENGYTEQESFMEKDTENTNAKEVLKEDTSQREINSQCKDGELHQERSTTPVRDLRNDSSDDFLVREHKAENGSLMKKDTENTNAELVLEDTNQREINSQCKDENEKGGELHPEKSKPVRVLRNDSCDDDPVREHRADNGFFEPDSLVENDTENTNAKQVPEKDVSQREINRQCKDEKKWDGELHPERSKDAGDLRNDSSNDIPGRKHKDENGYTKPEFVMEKDIENTKWHTGDTLQNSKLEVSSAMHILEKDTSMSKISGQCKDKKKNDRESGSVRSEAAVELRTDLTDDVFGSKHGSKNDFFDMRFLIKENEINREHTIQVGMSNLESELEVHKYLGRKDGSVSENKLQDDGRESHDTSCKKANDNHISSIDDRRRIANFQRERHVDGRNRRDKLPKELGINNRFHTDRYSGEASSSNHTNNMQNKRYRMEDNLTKNQYKKSKQLDSDQRIKSTCKSRMFFNQSEDYRDLRSQRKKQTLGDAERSAFNSSKLHSYADRNRSENRPSKKVDSVVRDNLSKSSPIPIISSSRSRNCLGCRSREEESSQREPLWHDKSCASMASTKDHGSTSEIHKRNSVYQHSNKFDYCVGENRSKNSPCSQVSKDLSRFKSNEGGSTRKEGSLSRVNLGVNVYSRVDHSSALGVRKRDSRQGYSEKDDPSTSHILRGPSWCRLRQGNSTERESLPHEKSRPSVAPTADNCSTPRVGKREPQYQPSEKADFSVCNDQSKNSSCSSVKYESGLKQGNSTRREPSSYEKFCCSVSSTVDHCCTPGVGKRDPECQHLEKVDFSVCDNQSKKPSISLVNKYQSGRRSKEGNSTSSSQAIDLTNRRARG